MVAARIANLQDGQRKSGSPIGEAVTQGEAAELLNVVQATSPLASGLGVRISW
jgi:hypothetical protein